MELHSAFLHPCSVSRIEEPVHDSRATPAIRLKPDMPDPVNHDRRRLLGAAALAVAGAPFGLLSPFSHFTRPVMTQSLLEGGLASLGRATTWLNSPPLTAAGLRG